MSAMERTTYRHPLFLSELQDQPDPWEFEPFAVSQQTSILTRVTSILTRVVAGGLVVSAFAIMVAVFIPMSRASLSTKQEHPWTARTGINQRHRSPRTNRLRARYC